MTAEEAWGGGIGRAPPPPNRESNWAGNEPISALLPSILERRRRPTSEPSDFEAFLPLRSLKAWALIGGGRPAKVGAAEQRSICKIFRACA